jgi:hypothetical protein
MACLDQNQNDIACNDPDCTYGDCTNSVAVTGGVAASTVSPNPSVAGGVQSTSDFTQLAGVAGQWGATIAAIVGGQPVVTSKGQVRTGVAALAPTAQPMGGMGLILILGLVIVAIVVIGRK